MSQIAVFADLEEGHLLASFGLMRTLLERGNGIVYVGVPDVRPIVGRQGFAFDEIMGDLFPLGFDRTVMERNGGSAQAVYFGSLVRGQVLDDVMQRIRPSLVLINSLLALEALVIRYRYRIPVTLLTTSLLSGTRRERFRSAVQEAIELRGGLSSLMDLMGGAGIRVTKMHDIVDLLLDLPEFLCQPRGFDVPSRTPEPNLFHIGAALDPHRVEPEYSWDGFDLSRPIVYCSLGSQAHMRPKTSIRFFKQVIEAFALRPDWQLILALGAKLTLESLGPVPPGVHVCNWAPQIRVLQRSAAMITHAGIGTVRECIDLTVPMVAFPLMRDQFDACELITHHGIGVAGNINTAKPAEIAGLVDRVVSDPSIRDRLRSIRSLFGRREDLELAIEFLERNALGAAAG
jgi:MGT family glycosyltransferase